MMRLIWHYSGIGWRRLGAVQLEPPRVRAIAANVLQGFLWAVWHVLDKWRFG